jgi:hypothetical protein
LSDGFDIEFLDIATQWFGRDLFYFLDVVMTTMAESEIAMCLVVTMVKQLILFC